MNIYNKLPSIDQLNRHADIDDISVCKVNGHFHTPYSFSAFSEMEQVLKMAEEEKVDVLGINDFYTMAGYEEFANLCLRYKKFPLFNIEFMGLLKREQEQGIKVNDPNNPGRTYLSGKGLDYPVSPDGDWLKKLNNIRSESDIQIEEMVGKAASYLAGIDPVLSMDYQQLLRNFTKGMVRERHIAKAIRIKVFENYSGEEERKRVLEKIYGGKTVTADINDAVALEGEIREMLLKSGGVAYVVEDPRAFLEISEVIEIILHAGGIPCYPVLLDDKNGNYTEYESDMDSLYKNLCELKVFSVELIPGRNKVENLEPFVRYFDSKDFVLTFGTEHNTPAMDPLTVRAGNSELGEYLTKVSYEGACVIAAHQYLRTHSEQGFLDGTGNLSGEKSRFVRLGNAVIQNFLK